MDGDNWVSFLGRVLSGRDRRDRSQVCFPGAGECQDSKGYVRDPRPVCSFNEEVNDLKFRNKAWHNRFREAVERVDDLRGIPVVNLLCLVAKKHVKRVRSASELLQRTFGTTFKPGTPCFQGMVFT